MNHSRLVYVVDDDDAVRESMSMLLEAHGLTVRSFPSAASFLEKTRGEGADFLLFDVHMPGMSGVELLELLRSRGVRTPAVILTGRLDPLMLPRLQKTAAAAVLRKPVETEILLAHFERAAETGPAALPHP